MTLCSSVWSDMEEYFSSDQVCSPRTRFMYSLYFRLILLVILDLFNFLKPLIIVTSQYIYLSSFVSCRSYIFTSS
jgi:hypothetical protein